MNYNGTLNLAESCNKHGLKLLYISTDYVFSGEGDEPFETDSPKYPCNFYGQSKLDGEKAVENICDKYFIVRISWVFGENGKNFVKTMLRLSDDRDEISVVCDQIGSPTYTKDLANLLCDMIATDKYGEYHARNAGFCTWAELAEETFRIAGRNTKVNRVNSEQYKTAAVRPKNSRLSLKSLTDNSFTPLQHWKDAVNEYLGNIL